MRFFYFSWIITLALSMMNGHAQYLTRTVVSAFGTNNTTSGIYVSSTVGESISGTISCSQNYLTQGFHQPLDTLSDDPYDINLDAIDVFPNPFTDWIKVVIEVKDINNYFIDVFSIQGSKIHSFELNDISSGEYEINLEELPPGVYLLQVRSALLKTNRTFRIIKT